MRLGRQKPRSSQRKARADAFFNERIAHQRASLHAFSGSTIERYSEGRATLDVEAALADENAIIYLLADDRVLVRNADGVIGAAFHAAEAHAAGLIADSVILLGVVEKHPRFAGRIAPLGDLPEGLAMADLRALAISGTVPQAHLAALAQARSYLYWNETNRFCGRCGTALESRGAGASRVCPHCEAEVFPRVDPVVIMLALDGDRCLLGRQPRFAPGMYSALAGFLEPGETIEEAVRREVKEESGIKVGRVAYHSSQPWPFPSSLMIGCHCEALSTEVERDAAELEDCRWFEREEVRLMLAGTHPQGLKAPFPMAIAHHLIKAFAEAE